MITYYCQEDLTDLRQLVDLIPVDTYTFKSPMLADSTIGQHVRHVLEFYGCVLHGDADTTVNYDKRERSHELENDPIAASIYISRLIELLGVDMEDRPLLLEADFSTTGDISKSLVSSLYRELAYCLEHSIHHKALIKVGLLAQGKAHLIPQDFGVAASTIRNRMAEATAKLSVK